VSFEVVNSLEATLIGSIDVGLAMGNAIAAAESLGLGTVPIGGIRIHTLKVSEILNLPQYVYPLCGLVIGHPADPSAKKPRLPKEAVVFEETYNDQLKDYINRYDDEMSRYMHERTNGQSDRNWSMGVSQFYKNKSSRNVHEDMEKKGFKNE